MNIGRNSPCHCGSGKKYKHCHLKIDDSQRHPALGNASQNWSGFQGRRRIHRDEDFIKGMVLSCRLAKKTLDMISDKVVAGVSTGKLNELIHNYIVENNAYPATLNYNGFTKSSCISINEVICHGIPNDKVILKEGDIVNIDVTTNLNGFFGDTSRTYLIGNCSNDAKRITDITRQCLQFAQDDIKPYMKIGDIGHCIQTYAESQGCSVVEQFVGHSIGTKFHEDPQIPHFGKKDTGPVILPGMCFTIEPMINLGVKQAVILEDGWTAVTKDGALSAQFEHTYLVTDTHLRPLTDENDDDPIF